MCRAQQSGNCQRQRKESERYRKRGELADKVIEAVKASGGAAVLDNARVKLSWVVSCPLFCTGGACCKHMTSWHCSLLHTAQANLVFERGLSGL